MLGEDGGGWLSQTPCPHPLRFNISAPGCSLASSLPWPIRPSLGEKGEGPRQAPPARLDLVVALVLGGRN